jgi:hypothetical protein
MAPVPSVAALARTTEASISQTRLRDAICQNESDQRIYPQEIEETWAVRARVQIRGFPQDASCAPDKPVCNRREDKSLKEARDELWPGRTDNEYLDAEL